MRILRASWFYLHLLLANLQFLSWFFWCQYFQTQVVGVGVAWLLVGGLLVVRQLAAWHVPNLALKPQFSPLAENPQITWRLAMPPQTSWLCHHLEQAQALQPTHRDILINLSFCRTLENRSTDSKNIWQTTSKLDPNAEIFASKSDN